MRESCPLLALLVLPMLATVFACGGNPPDAPPPAPLPGGAAEAPQPAGPPVGAWTLVAIDGVDIDDDLEATLTVDPDGRLTGSSGCNRYTTEATFEGASMTVGPIAGTRRACPDPQASLEARFLGALESVVTFETADAVLRLHDRDGAVRLEFRRAEGEDSAA